MIREDGYRVTRFRSLFTREAVLGCEILVIANPQARSNMFGPGAPDSNWAYPDTSALTAEEISEVVLWIRSGGALFLISDHAPLAAAVSDLGLLLGVNMLDGYTFASVENMTREDVGEIAFGTVRGEEWRRVNRLLGDLVDLDFDAKYEPVLTAPGTLAPHPVVEGRNAQESIEWILT